MDNKIIRYVLNSDYLDFENNIICLKELLDKSVRMEGMISQLRYHQITIVIEESDSIL